MNVLDMRTLILNYFVSNVLCTSVVAHLWSRNRYRFAGLDLWLAFFAAQTVYMPLVILRGIVPDWISMVASNVLLVSGPLLLYIGLERFVDQRSTQVHNYVLLAIFTVIQAYFVFVQPNLAAREINISVGLSVICFQGAWLMLRRINADMRPITKGLGLTFLAFCLVSIARIIVTVVIPPGHDFLKESGLFDTLLMLTYQMLFIVLTFSLSLMINHRLLTEQTTNIAKQQQVETALRKSEEKFSKAFHASPDAIVLSRLRDGRIIEVNEGFSSLSEYSQEEALANSSITLELWANPQDRERCISALRENHSVRDFEYDFHTKSGRILKCLYSGEIIDLGGEAHMLSVVRDITERKQTEEALREKTEELDRFFSLELDLLCIADTEGNFHRLNRAWEQTLGYPLADLEGHRRFI
jgi:PAS domain S-box-containing protein